MKTSVQFLAPPTAVLAALLLAGCGQKPAAGPETPAAAGGADSGEEKVLNVYNWSDYIDPSVLEDFTRETGIKINYDVFDSNEALETKLLTGNTGYDIVVPSASFLERQIKAGVFRKLDTSLLPNLKNLDPEITQRVALHDPGNEHSVNYLWGTSGVGYNVAKIKERLPDAPVDSFAMFYDPQVVSKFKDCGVTLLDAPSEVVGTVLIWLGKDANSEKAEDLAAAEKVLMAIRPYVKYVNSSKYIEDLANGEVCLSLGWSGDVLQSRDRAREAGKGIEVNYLIPREGAVMFFDMLAIPADAKRPKNAHLFIDYLLRPEIAAKNSEFVNFANSNAASWPLISEAVRNDRGVYPSDEVKPKLVPDLAESQEFTRQLTRTWTRFKTGK
ncbi:MAG: polyamine ABC transporter substrate-binding protein [Sinobacteraceae bacterium]|nr:polyamine ABC transporter substrate-binding protein [Nevskiaceae bacterium]MCP5359683.1 polyamine ABC transporter substrate-binding protein [Nevskiaceae bacterium]MCP5472523.1 polyamine ABC transporter substrate-binding protein [Nevskiaceae bacterium]